MSGWISEEVGGGGGGGTGDGLTDAQLRAAPVPFSATVLPLPTGAATATAQTTTNQSLASIDQKLPALVDGKSPISGEVVASNITGKFRDAFETYVPNTDRWVESLGTGDLVFVDGNAAAASYLVISKDPLSAGTETSVETVGRFGMPIEMAFGGHMSQRTVGQEFSVEIVSAEPGLADIPDLEISAITQVTTTLTVTTVLPHGLSVGKSIGLRSMLDSRLNYPALVLASVPAPNQFTCTAGPGGNIPSISAYITSVLAATTAALPTAVYANGTAGVGATLTASANGAFPAQDGISIPLNGRVLVKNQAAPAENGIYILTTVGAAGAPWVLTRAPDFDTAAEMTVIANALYAVSVFTSGGTTQGQKEYYLSATVTTVGTTAVTFVDSGTIGPIGFVFFRERFGRAQNGVAQIFENATVTNASLYIRSESGDALPSGTIAGNHSATTSTTAPIQLINSPYTYAFAPSSEFRINIQADRAQWYDSAVDAVTQTTSRLLRTQVCPDPGHEYKLRIRATNNKSLSAPSAQIVSAVKSGTTTGIINTDRPHGLVTGELVVVYGIRDQTATSFPNVVAATPITVIDATSFSIIIGTAGTVNSYGGFVARVNGGNLPSALGANAIVVQSASLSTLVDGTRQLVLVGSGSWAGLSIGDLTNAIGVRDNTTGATLGVDGPWKVANVVTTALTLVLPFSAQRSLPVDFASTNCGGAIIKRTDLRLSFIRVFDYERLRVETLSRPTGDSAGGAPVNVQNTIAATQSGTWTVAQGTAAAVSGRWYTQATDGTSTQAVKAASVAAAVADPSAVFTMSPNSFYPIQIADVASAALTATTTTATITPTGGLSYEINIPVTAVTGTAPTLDMGVEESDDGGTNWFRVYDFPRITATGMYRSPKLPATGNRIRYVQTVTGTTPSFTRAVNRNQCYDQAPLLRQLIDRSVVLTTLNSVTPVLNVQNARNAQLVINVGAATTPPAIQLEGSVDGGLTWVAVGSPLTAIASSTVQLTVNNVQFDFLRARVSTAGATVTAGYVLIKGF